MLYSNYHILSGYLQKWLTCPLTSIINIILVTWTVNAVVSHVQLSLVITHQHCPLLSSRYSYQSQECRPDALEVCMLVYASDVLNLSEYVNS